MRTVPAHSGRQGNLLLDRYTALRTISVAFTAIIALVSSARKVGIAALVSLCHPRSRRQPLLFTGQLAHCCHIDTHNNVKHVWIPTFAIMSTVLGRNTRKLGRVKIVNSVDSLPRLATSGEYIQARAASFHILHHLYGPRTS